MTSTILITGGTGKLGRKYVEHFSQKGWKVVFTSTSAERANTLIENLESDRPIVGLECDLKRPESAAHLLQELRAWELEINHLVNNARSFDTLKVGEDGVTQRSDFMSEYLIDVVVPYELTMTLWQAQPFALQTVNNISSQYSIVAANPNLYDDPSNQSPIQYGVAKSALNHLTRELAVRLAPDDIRVNAVAYGGVRGRTDAAFQERYGNMVPNGRMLEEADVVGPLDFLVSEQSASMTGQVIQADGGWTIW